MPNSDTINTADTMTVTVLSLTSVISTQGTQRTPVAWVVCDRPADRRYIHTVGQSSES